MRYTTKSANAYLNQYDLSVEQNKAVTATRTNGQVIGWWNVYGVNESTGKRYRLTTQPTLTEAMEQARWHLLEGRPSTAIAMGQASCELPVAETLTLEREGVDNHSQHLDLGYCFQMMPSGVVHVYDPDGNPHIATDIDNADQCIRDGVWNCGQQCPVEVDMSPIDDCGSQEVVISPAINDSKLLLAQGYDPDEHWLCEGVVLTLDGDVEVGHISEPCYRPAYLTEQEYRDSEALMEF